MNEKNYYRVTVKVQYEGKKGELKNRKEDYIVEAISPTDVELKMANHMKGSTEDYEITSIVVTKIIDIIK